MENTENHIELCGMLLELPVLSHENHGRRFYRFCLEVERMSGAKDCLPIVAAEEILNDMDVFGGSMLCVTGQIRSFNNRGGGGRKLVISVYAENLSTCDREPFNDVALCGAICKEPIYRRTPLGREICDIMLAVNRAYHRTDYIPCILWGRTAEETALFPIGTRLCLTGRLQSRQYVKALSEGTEIRTTYEVSAVSAHAVNPEENILQTAEN